MALFTLSALLPGLISAAESKAEPKPIETTRFFSVDGIEALDIKTTRGDIMVTGTDRLTLKVELTNTEDAADCRVIAKPDARPDPDAVAKLEEDSDEDEENPVGLPKPAPPPAAPKPKIFRLQVKDRKKASKGKCVVGLRVEAPRRMAVHAASGTGTIDAAGFDGDFSADEGAGDVRLNDLRGAVRAKTGTGSVTGALSAEAGVDIVTGAGAVKISGLKGPVVVETGTGAVSLEYAAVPAAKSATRIKTGAASAAVFFPEGSKIRTEFKSGMGHLANDLGETPEADFLLSMNTGMGSLIVNKVKEAKQ